MSLYEIQGYTLVLGKIVFITRVFEAAGNAGAQFNIQLEGSAILRLRFPDRADATLTRELLVKALKSI